jgi:hypothetical protein
VLVTDLDEDEARTAKAHEYIITFKIENSGKRRG